MRKGKGRLNIVIIKAENEIKYSYKFPPARAFFIVTASKDIQRFYLRSLMWLVEIAERKVFLEKWQSAKKPEDLRKIVLTLWRDRQRFFNRLNPK